MQRQGLSFWLQYGHMTAYVSAKIWLDRKRKSEESAREAVLCNLWCSRAEVGTVCADCDIMELCFRGVITRTTIYLFSILKVVTNICGVHTVANSVVTGSGHMMVLDLHVPYLSY